MSQRKGLGIVALFLCVISVFVFLRSQTVEPQTIKTSAAQGYTIVIDAGHGGEDSGTIGVNGVLEKNLNLKIASDLAEMLKSAGYSVLLTRTDDRLVLSPEQNVRGKRKVYDLKNRLSIASSLQNPILCSIHMNSFPEEKYKGFQVYYSGNCKESRTIAGLLQERVTEGLQPWNNREIKQADSSIYILAEAKIPAILVECGFLSNAEECAFLCEEDYQKRLSFLMFCAMIEYIEMRNANLV